MTERAQKCENNATLSQCKTVYCFKNQVFLAISVKGEIDFLDFPKKV